jgi:hypothetical protein
MNCHEFRKGYIVLLDPDSAAAAARAELTEHLKTCRSCAQFYDEITRTVALLRPSTQVNASPQFKGNVMNRIMQEATAGHAPAQTRETRRMKVWQPALAAGIAGLLVCGVLLWLKFHSAGNDFAKMPAFSLFREACAAEESVFAREGITSIFNEIIVKPRTDFYSSMPVMMPLNSLGTSGQFLFDMLTIPRQPGERCTVEDRAWRDQATGRFVRVMTIGGKAIFANSYDGRAIYRLQPDAAGNMKIGEKPVAADFRLPASPAELLGLGSSAKVAALSDEKARAYISDAGPAVLPDGSAARVIKVTMQDLPGLPEAFREMFSDSYALYTIRRSDNTIAQWEMVLKGQPLMELRRVATRTVEAPGVPWNLAGVQILPPQSSEAPQPAVTTEAQPKGPKESFEKLSVSNLRRQAVAEEKSLFAGEGILSLASELILKPVTDPILAKARSMKIGAINASGKLEPATLALPANPGEQYTLENCVWFDRKTGRFARVLTIGGEAVFANGYDGSSVYGLEPDAAGVMRIVAKPVAANFKPPKDVVELLGFAEALDDNVHEKNFSDAGPATLSEGMAARVIKLSMGEIPGLSMLKDVLGSSPYKLFTIRKSDGLCVQVECVWKGESALVTRLTAAETVAAPGVPWNLTGVKVRAALPPEGTLPSAGPVMMGPSISVQQMAAMSDYETYVFAADPPWTTERRIMAQKDPSGPLSWMFVTAWRAKDGRHVVMIQAQMYNKMFGKIFAMPEGPQAQAMMKNMMLSYTSPTGFKVWNMSKEMPMGAMMLKITGDWLSFEPLSDSAGFLIQTPAGMVPALAVNGKLTDDELHALIDSLIPAKEYLKKFPAPAATGAEKAGTASP